MDKRLLVAAVAVGMLSIGALFFLEQRHSGASLASPGGKEAHKGHSLRRRESMPSDGRSPGAGKSIEAIHPFSHLPRTRNGLPLENDPFVAESRAEQQWLDRNGYPNAEQWAAYSAASDGLLAQAAAAGDRVAAVMLDGRALMRGDKKAPDRLFKEAASGSMFALSLLAGYMAGAPAGDPGLAYSISRVMEMKGDTRAAIGREAMFPRPLSPEVRVRAEADAVRLFEELKKHSTRQPIVDPRPFRG